MKYRIPRAMFSLFVGASLLTGPVVEAGKKSKNSDPSEPQRVRSQKRLAKLLQERQPRYYSGFRTGLAALQAADSTPSTPSTAPSHSSTLVQVAGVDEGDRVKNDGEFIYQINQGRVLVIDASPASELNVAATLEFSDGSFYPQELYLHDGRLVVIGTAFRAPEQVQTSRFFAPIWFFSTSTTQAKIYDISDKSKITLAREVEIEGDLVASRKIGSSLYLVGRRYPNFYAYTDAGESKPERDKDGLVPSYRDTARSGEFRRISLKHCFYFPGFDDPNYLVIAGFDLGDPDSGLDVDAYLGAGEQVFASQQNLYVAASRFEDVFLVERVGLLGVPVVSEVLAGAAAAVNLVADGEEIDPEPPVEVPTNTEHTLIYKFALEDGASSFVAHGDVPGTILNQYSMDEHNGHFRVATTEHAWWNWWWETDQVDQNNLYVLGPDMQRVGQVENIAPGERIYAARFLGDRAFLVTFQTIDPLFAIDLSDPANPEVVGELTLPGFSNFLLPYDENHLIGFGKDVLVVDDQGGGEVPWWNGQAFFQGVKLALFDVTDLHNPSLMFSEIIGDRGTDSAALWDPHALLFDRAKNLLALPITLADVPDDAGTDPWAWGEYVFEGAYVYNVTLENGFQLRGTITHRSDDDEEWWGWWNESIDRLLYIDNDLYSLSNAKVKANDLDTLEEKATLELPQPSYDDGGGVIILSAEETGVSR